MNIIELYKTKVSDKRTKFYNYPENTALIVKALIEFAKFQRDQEFDMSVDFNNIKLLAKGIYYEYIDMITDEEVDFLFDEFKRLKRKCFEFKLKRKSFYQEPKRFKRLKYALKKNEEEPEEF